jgi:hypothetical protein
LRILVLSAAVVVVAVVAAGVWYAQPLPGHSGPLTGAEITALLSGSTVKGPKFSEFYTPDGSIRGREVEDEEKGEDDEYLGTWRVDGDQLCVAFPSHKYTNCVSVSLQQGSVYDFAGAARTIIEGNPNKL